MLKLYFDYKDVFRAARLGLSPKKMWVLFCGLLLGFVSYGVFGYLAHLAAGRSLADVWAIFGLVPLPWNDFGVWAWLLWAAGALCFLVCYLLSAAVAAKITTEQLQGNEFFEAKEGVKFLKENWKSALGGPAVLILFAVFILICGLLMGLWGRIPVVGELTVSLFAIPVYFVCLFLVFLAVALVVGVFYAPVITGATKSDTFDSLFETFSSITGQPWRLVVYTALLKLVSLAGFLVFGCFTAGALAIAFNTLGFAMGEKFVNIAVAGFNNYTPGWALDILIRISRGCGPCQFLLAAPDLNWAGQISAFIVGMSINAIRLLMLAYLMSSFVAGQTIIYGIIVMKRDERNIFAKPEEKEAPATA
ncbi:MAG: hypothetical protein QME74_09440, partial [Candidatus Edwardsbacteria bacterium]|nr:hypothetical protein [Candidatus Edwardsbacteria bacterium]